MFHDRCKEEKLSEWNLQDAAFREFFMIICCSGNLCGTVTGNAGFLYAGHVCCCIAEKLKKPVCIPDTFIFQRIVLQKVLHTLADFISAAGRGKYRMTAGNTGFIQQFGSFLSVEMDPDVIPGGIGACRIVGYQLRRNNKSLPCGNREFLILQVQSAVPSRI